MNYTVPTNDYQPKVEATRRAKNADSCRRQIVTLWLQQYHEFWGLDRGDIGQAEMQAILDELPSAGDILTDSAGFLQWVSSAHPDLLVAADEHSEPFIASKYTASPYEMTIDPGTGRILLGPLVEAWRPADSE